MKKSRLQKNWEKWSSWISTLPFLGDQITRYLVYTLITVVLVGVIGVLIYDRIHLFNDYSITSQAEENDVDGTEYILLGTHVIKYSHDGLFCVNLNNQTQWSSAYSMQTPICAQCGNTVVIAEQQGNLVYVLNEDGILGSFETSLPIIRAEVSTKGMVALTLEDTDVTWINLYQADGTLTASVKTTMSGSGYPLDLALTEDGKRMMVSFVSIEDGDVIGKLAFYDFSSADEADEDHLAGTISYNDMIFSDVYYTSDSKPVAVSDAGYVVFSADRLPEEKKKIVFTDEIVSIFYDDDLVGFVFHSSATDERYQIYAYNLNGRQMMSAAIDFEYTEVRMQNGEVLLYDTGKLYVLRSSGKQKADITYESEVNYFASLSGLRKYLVITDTSMDQISLS